MSRSRYKIYGTEYPYFLTSSIVDGIPLFANPEISDFILNGFQFLQKATDVDIFAYVIMENHHAVLNQLMRAKLSHKHQSKYQVWQEGFHPKQITTPEMMLQKIEYIHHNPVKRGYVDEPEYWRYSSARNYLELEYLIPVTLYEG